MRSKKRQRRFVGFESLENRQLLSTTYYVATTGNDNNTGTSVGTAFQTLQEGVSQLQAGDTLDIEAGSYAGFVVGYDPAGEGIYGAIDGTSTNPITIQADPSAAAGSVVITSREDKSPDGIDLEPDDNYITLKGISIVADSTISSYGIKVAQSNNVNIIDCSATDCGLTGIYTSFATNGLIEGNVSYENGEHGFYLANSPTGDQVIDNISHNNASGGIQINADASQGGPGIATGMLVEGNVIYENGSGNGDSSRAGGGALNMDGLQDSVIENNLLYNNHGSGLVLYDGDAAQGSIDNLVVNNTIIQASDGREALNNNTNSFGNVFFNNIFLGSMLVDSSSTPAAWSNNILLSNYSNDGDYNFPAGVSSTASALFANTSGTFAQPADYLLSSSSPAVNAGLASLVGQSAPTSDISGSPFAGDVGTFQNVGSAQNVPPPPPPTNQGPTIANNAAAGSSVVTGKSTTLSALGADDSGESNLTYTWSSSGPASVSFGANGSNASKNTSVTFSKAGVYSFIVTIKDSAGLSVTSEVNVTVAQMLTSLSVTPNGVTVTEGTAQQYNSSGKDQFGAAMAAAVVWSATDGAINGAGLYTAGQTAGTATITATSGSIKGTALATVQAPASPPPPNPGGNPDPNPPPPPQTSDSPPTISQGAQASDNTVTTTSVDLSVGASDPQNQNLTYTWQASGPAPVDFSENGSQDASNTTATFNQAGNYLFSVTVTDESGLSVTSNVKVSVEQTLSDVEISNAPSQVTAGSQTQFTAEAFDQFGDPMAQQPSFAWSMNGAGSLDTNGVYTASSGAPGASAPGAGSATITVSADGLTDSTSVSVSAGSMNQHHFGHWWWWWNRFNN